MWLAEGQLGVVPVIVVLEEAQNVLSVEDVREGNPFVRWTKEGRKYNLGSILITQQPGAIAQELLAQGDNFFSFHLISQVDLKTLQRDNAHYSDDILTHILNEPIKGNVYFWSAPDQPFVLPSKILNFERYVDDLKKNLQAKEEIPFQTPAEEFINAQSSLVRDLDDLIKASLERKPTIALYGNILLQGERLENTCATKFWNLRFGVSDDMTQDMKNTFCEDFNGRAVIREQILLESLQRLGILRESEIGISEGDSQYLLLDADKLSVVGKRVKDEQIQLNA